MKIILSEQEVKEAVAAYVNDTQELRLKVEAKDVFINLSTEGDPDYAVFDNVAVNLEPEH